MSAEPERRAPSDRRRVSRGGRRPNDQSGRYPPILIADERPEVREACARFLQQFNFDVAVAADGEEALTWIMTMRPRVVIAECSLPSLPADRLAEWLANTKWTRDTPVIVLADEAQHVDSLRTSGIVLTPLSLPTMLEELRRVLRMAPSVG